MTLKEIVSTVHAAFVAKAQKKVAAGESAQTFAEVGGDVVEYGGKWCAAVANDGKLDDTEVVKIRTEFDERFLKRVPEVKGIGLTLLWEGVTLFGIGFKGVKWYLNKWFELGL